VPLVKKLKMIGQPYKIKKNTAFIREMFTSKLEVSKFLGAALKTVSGIRGQVKKAERTPPGAFRATFEDKIVPSDLVTLRAWVPVEIPRFVAPVLNLLQANHQWVGMKTLGELRRERGLKIPQRRDSAYRPVIRQPRLFPPLKVPVALAEKLPFKSAPKLDAPRQKATLETRRAVVLDKEEKKRLQVLQQLGTLKNERLRKQAEKRKLKVVTYMKKRQREEAKRQTQHKKNRHNLFRLEGLAKAAPAEGKRKSKRQRTE